MALDDRLAEVALGAAQPTLGAIKLAWWRDQLAALDTQPPPPEPRLQAVARAVIPAVSGADLSGMAEGWMALLDEAEDPAPRGRALFGVLGKLLGHEAVGGGDAFSRADLARRTGERRWLSDVPVPPAARGARAVSALDVLGKRDASRPWPPEPEATPGRSWLLLKHRFTGR